MKKQESDKYISVHKSCGKCPVSTYTEHIYAITHEMRSPLSVINGQLINQLNYLRDLFHEVSKNEKNVSLIKKLKESIFAIEQQTEQIEMFITNVSEHGSYCSTATDKSVLLNMSEYIQTVYKNALYFTKKMAVFGPEGIKFDDNHGSDFKNINVIVNPFDLNRILMNVVSNAAEAVNKKYNQRKDFVPLLKIRCLKSIEANQTLQLHNTVHGPFASPVKECEFFIIIEDNGTGILPEHMNKIFNNGFTTNEDDDTHYGLGLHLIMELAKKNNLSIFIETKLGDGTKFMIGFPKMFVGCKEMFERKHLKYNDIINYEEDYSTLLYSEGSKQLYKELVMNCSPSTDFHYKKEADSQVTISFYSGRKKKNS